MLLPFPAANRDPSVFPDADKVVLDRVENRHAAFGLGIHRCLGSNLARMELRVALEEWMAATRTSSSSTPQRHLVGGPGARPAFRPGSHPLAESLCTADLCSAHRSRSRVLADQLGQFGEPVGVAPFVVVPAEHLGQATRGHRELTVEHARGGRADDVGGDEIVDGVVDDAHERAVVGSVTEFALMSSAERRHGEGRQDR